MEYSAINVIECRIHADAPGIYIADVWIGGSGIILDVMFVVIARTSKENRTTNIVVNVMTSYMTVIDSFAICLSWFIKQLAELQKSDVRISIYLESKHVKPPEGITKSTCSEQELT